MMNIKGNANPVMFSEVEPGEKFEAQGWIYMKVRPAKDTAACTSTGTLRKFAANEKVNSMKKKTVPAYAAKGACVLCEGELAVVGNRRGENGIELYTLEEHNRVVSIMTEVVPVERIDITLK